MDNMKQRIRKAMLLLGWLFLLCFTANSQNLVMKKIVERSDLDKEQMYNAAKDWYHLKFNHTNEDLVINESFDEGKLMYRIWFDYYSKYNGVGNVTCTFEISVKPGKVRFLLMDITQQYRDLGRPSLFSIQEEYDLEKYDKRMEKKGIEHDVPIIKNECNKMLNSFVEYINAYKPKNLDW